MIRSADYVERMKKYVKDNLKKGYTRDSLKQALVNQGHSRFSVEKAITLAEQEVIAEAPILNTPPAITEIIQPIEEKRSLWKRLFG